MPIKFIIIWILLPLSLIFPRQHALAILKYSYYSHSLSVPNSIKTGNQDLASALGQGWSSDNNVLVGQCLLGSINHIGTPYGSLTLDTLYHYDEFLNQMNLKIDGNFSLLGFKAGLSSEYENFLKDTKYSQTLIYRAIILLKNRHFMLPNKPYPLTWFGKQYINDPKSFRLHCGDQFVAEQQIGGALYVIVKFNFLDQQTKLKFNNELHASFQSLANLTINLKNLSQSFRSNGDISLMAFQIGGDPTKLGNILGGDLQSKTAAVLDCALSNLDACYRSLNLILIYASQPGANNFPSQFSVDDESSLVGPGIIKNIYQSYDTVLPIPATTSLVTSEVFEARRWLSEQFEQNIIATNQVNSIIDDNPPLSHDYFEKLLHLKEGVTMNADMLSRAGQRCFANQLMDCLPAVAEARSLLATVDLKPFEKRIMVYGKSNDYLFPYSMNQYIYGSHHHFYLNEIFNVEEFLTNSIVLSLPKMAIRATSMDRGATYQGKYINNRTHYTENMTLIPDFNVTENMVNKVATDYALP